MIESLPYILVVDDEEINRQVAAAVLTDEGQLRVGFAGSGEEALSMVAESPPDLILLDLVMQGMSGYEVCQALKEHEQYRNIPVLFLTALNSVEDLVKGFQIGGADYITKPFNEMMLKARVTAHLQSYLYLKKERSYMKDLEQAVKERTEELTKANQAKDEFLARMSHELRTPITAIIGNSELLKSMVHKSPELEPIATAIEGVGRAQLSLVNDLLDLFKIDAGQLTIEASPYSFSGLMQEIEKILKVRSKESRLQVQVNQQNSEANKLLGDAQRITQILVNLIDNAMKFTEQGRVTVTSSVHNNQLSIAVSDTGIGISDQAMETLFHRFEQANGALSRRFGGAGLGLYISQTLAQLMEGEIAVTSHEQKGSTFTLMLPYQPTEEQEVERRKPEGGEQQRFSGRVLVAEDTPEMQLLVKRILTRKGCTVDLASNGQEAMEKGLQEHYDLVLMDMQMPIMDGIEATQMLRSLGANMPIVALTANVMAVHREQFEQAGADGFLTKPIQQEKLNALLAQYLKQVEGDETVEPD